VDAGKFEQGRKLYDAGDYRGAAAMYLDAVDHATVVGNGPAYHMAGNALLRIKRYADAVTLYEHALRDEAYTKRSGVQTNLATAMLQSGDYAEAVKHFERALEESDCLRPYRCYNGIGHALMKQERWNDAALAFRRAALDPDNPDPGKSLVNLGLCLAAAGKPEDAIAAYQAGLGFDSYRNRGRALVNLGFAYFATRQWQDAVRSFSEAQEAHGTALSTDALTALERAQAHLRATGPIPDAGEHALPAATESAPVLTAGARDSFTEGAATPSLGESPTGSGPIIGSAADIDQFFARTESEMKVRSREFERAKRGRFGWLKWVLLLAVFVGMVAGAGAWAWLTGFGAPPAMDTVGRLMEQYNTGQPMEQFWASDATDITRSMTVIPAPSTYVLSEFNPDGLTATVALAITPEQGEELRFTVSLVREGTGWKVTAIDPVVAGDPATGAPDSEPTDPSVEGTPAP